MAYMLGSWFLYLARAPKTLNFLMIMGSRPPLPIKMSCLLSLGSLKDVRMGVLVAKETAV